VRAFVYANASSIARLQKFYLTTTPVAVQLFGSHYLSAVVTDGTCAIVDTMDNPQ